VAPVAFGHWVLCGAGGTSLTTAAGVGALLEVSLLYLCARLTSNRMLTERQP